MQVKAFFRLCDSDFGITPVDDITSRITWAVLLLLLLLFVNSRINNTQVSVYLCIV
jgi:hypothetical protein